MVSRVILAEPRGFCAGVDRAIEIVEKAYKKFGSPIYVRHDIVHNKTVTKRLEREFGAIFVEDLVEIPPGSRVVFSAHGVSPQVKNKANLLNLRIIDATCPLVDNVHNRALQYDREGTEIILIGHPKHQEVRGTKGYAPMHIVENVGDVRRLRVKNPNRLAYITQTTLGKFDVEEIEKALKKRFPNLMQSKDDLCYATTNRQEAVVELSKLVQAILVTGDYESSNSKSLVMIAKRQGLNAYLISSYRDIQEEWLRGINSIGLTSGASTPESLIREVIDYFKRTHNAKIETLKHKEEGEIKFNLPEILSN